LRLGSVKVFLRHMLGVHAPWRSSQWVYALRSCSVKVVIAGICLAFMLRGGRLAWNMFSCCETTSKVAVSRQAYAPLTSQWKRDDLQSRYYGYYAQSIYPFTRAIGSGTTFHSPLYCKAIRSTQNLLCCIWQLQISLPAQETFHPLMAPHAVCMLL
jgi:hypothetical protein